MSRFIIQNIKNILYIAVFFSLIDIKNYRNSYIIKITFSLHKNTPPYMSYYSDKIAEVLNFAVIGQFFTLFGNYSAQFICSFLISSPLLVGCHFSPNVTSSFLQFIFTVKRLVQLKNA